MFKWLFGKKNDTGEKIPVNISPDDVIQMMQSSEKYTILDVREQHEYRAGHIKGAVLVPLGQLPKRTHELRNDRVIVTVCQSGRRSAQAAKILRSQGFQNVRNMVGGMSNWPGKVAK